MLAAAPRWYRREERVPAAARNNSSAQSKCLCPCACRSCLELNRIQDRSKLTLKGVRHMVEDRRILVDQEAKDLHYTFASDAECDLWLGAFKHAMTKPAPAPAPLTSPATPSAAIRRAASPAPMVKEVSWESLAEPLSVLQQFVDGAMGFACGKYISKRGTMNPVDFARLRNVILQIATDTAHSPVTPTSEGDFPYGRIFLPP